MFTKFYLRKEQFYSLGSKGRDYAELQLMGEDNSGKPYLLKRYVLNRRSAVQAHYDMDFVIRLNNEGKAKDQASVIASLAEYERFYRILSRARQVIAEIYENERRVAKELGFTGPIILHDEPETPTTLETVAAADLGPDMALEASLNQDVTEPVVEEKSST